LDGVRRGPRDTGIQVAENEDILSEEALKQIRKYLQRDGGKDLGFSLLALVANP
jgi:ubiquitin carboxyl-terminal hydrolase L3